MEYQTKIELFRQELTRLLFTKIDHGELDLTKQQVLLQICRWDEENGTLTYGIISWVWDKLDTATKETIDNYWNNL